MNDAGARLDVTDTTDAARPHHGPSGPCSRMGPSGA
jgi:hypothetical protein